MTFDELKQVRRDAVAHIRRSTGEQIAARASGRIVAVARTLR